MNAVPFTSRARVLLQKASEDREALNFELPHSIFGFHAQQAVEKLLKALIASHSQSFAYTHDLRQLWKSCVVLGEVFPELPWNPKDLQDYAVVERYEPANILPPEDRQKMRASVDILTAFVLQRAQTLTLENEPGHS